MLRSGIVWAKSLPSRKGSTKSDTIIPYAPVAAMRAKADRVGATSHCTFMSDINVRKTET